MLFFIIIGGILVFAVAIVGFLFYLLSKESKEPVAVKDLKGSAQIATSTMDIKKDPLFNLPVAAIPSNPLEAPEVIQMSREYAQKEVAYQNKVEQLEVELKEISQKAQGQSQEALDTIEKLRKENEDLKNQKVAPADDGLLKAQDTIQALHQEQENLQTRLSLSQEQAQKLQEEVVSIKHQMTQEITQTKEETEKLVIDNERLKSSLETVVAEATKNLQDEMGALKQENEALKTANQEAVLLNQKSQGTVSSVSQESLDGLQEEIERMKQQISALKSTNNDLLLANQGLKISLESVAAEAASTLQEELDVLKKENEELKAKAVNAELTATSQAVQAPLEPSKEISNDLILANQRIKELGEQNEHLTERLEALQWDLTKARAQTTSFERACENYQLQLKEALEKKGS